MSSSSLPGPTVSSSTPLEEDEEDEVLFTTVPVHDAPDTTSYQYYQLLDVSSIVEFSEKPELNLNPKLKKKEKRQDLQGIRGIAILSVLGFHFLPSVFPNGYLGVDQFFVLSGFLMCMLLRRSSSKSSSCQLIFQFYNKRLKRILPLYFLLIFLALVALFNVFPDTAVETNTESAKRALVFVSNRAMTQEEDYFAMLAIAIDIFTHTWSLSVEIQFYLIVPFLFIFGSKLISSRFQVHYYTILGLISFGFSKIFCSQGEAFNSVFARVWQFMIGMIVFIITENRQNTPEEPEKLALLSENLENSENSPKKLTKSETLKYFLLAGMIWITGYPIEMNPEILRPFFTISTGIVMVFSSGSDVILSSPLLTYIGDISYSLYLIHWPLYAYWKLVLSHGNIWNSWMIGVLVTAVVLAVISYEFYEKWYLKLTDKTLFIICIVLFIGSFGILEKDNISDFLSPQKNPGRLDGLNETGTISFEEADRLNKFWSKNDLKNLGAPTCEYEPGDGPLGWCRHTGLDANKGKWRFMLIGNSWSANHARIFYDECGKKAKSILQGSTRGCEPLHASHYAGQRCIDTVKMFAERVTEEKPDYGFLFSRFQDIGVPMPPNVTRLEDDPWFQSMKKQVDIYMKSIKKKLFILQALPEVMSEKVGQITEAIQSGQNLIEFDKSFIRRNETMARLRYSKLISECSRCVPIDYKPLFFNNSTQTWRFFDIKQNGLSYITSPNHLSFHGLEYVRHVYTDICNSL